jgi:hypothetical protein
LFPGETNSSIAISRSLLAWRMLIRFCRNDGDRWPVDATTCARGGAVSTVSGGEPFPNGGELDVLGDV